MNNTFANSTVARTVEVIKTYSCDKPNNIRLGERYETVTFYVGGDCLVKLNNGMIYPLYNEQFKIIH